MTFNPTNPSQAKVFIIAEEKTSFKDGNLTTNIYLKNVNIKTQVQGQKTIKEGNLVLSTADGFKLDERFRGRNVVIISQATRQPLEGRVSIMTAEDVSEMNMILNQHFARVKEERKKEKEHLSKGETGVKLREHDVSVREEVPSPAVKARFQMERRDEQERTVVKERTKEADSMDKRVVRTRIRFYERLAEKNEARIEQNRKNLGEI